MVQWLHVMLAAAAAAAAAEARQTAAVGMRIVQPRPMTRGTTVQTARDTSSLVLELLELHPQMPAKGVMWRRQQRVDENNNVRACAHMMPRSNVHLNPLRWLFSHSRFTILKKHEQRRSRARTFLDEHKMRATLFQVKGKAVEEP